MPKSKAWHKAQRHKNRPRCERCGKIIYPNETAAQLVVANAGRQRQELRYYLCPTGYGYHMTSQRLK